VGLTSLTDENVALFKETVLDSHMITFKECLGGFELPAMPELDYVSQNVYGVNFQELDSIMPLSRIAGTPGDRVIVRRNGVHIGTGSIGYRASIGGVRGFVTTAHLGLAATGLPLRPGDEFFVSGLANRIGYIRSANHVMLHNVDAAFVTLCPFFEFEINDTVAGRRISANRIPHIFRGQRLYAVGATSGFRIGEVLNIGLTFGFGVHDPHAHAYFVLNTILSAHIGAGGDSGGIVFAPENGNNFVVGIHLAHQPSGVNRGAIVAPYNEISRFLGTNLR
jgi:hypothetical protein